MTVDTIPLADLGTWYGGGTPSKAREDFWTDGTVPWLSPKDMGQDVLQHTQDSITNLAVEKSSVKLVPPGSVAVVVRSGILERKLPVGIVPFATTLNQDMKALHPREDVDPRWVAWGLRAFERDLLRQTRKDGTTVTSIEWPRFQQFEFPVPTLDEQQRIVELIEDHLSRFDAAEGYLHASLRGAAALDRQILDSEVAIKEAETVPFRDLLTERLANGRSVPSEDGGFPVLRLTALKDGRVDVVERKAGAWSAAEARHFLVQGGDFLIARGNGSLRLVGRGGLVIEDPDPVAYPDTLIRARPNPSAISPEFLSLVWNAPAIRRQIERAARTTAGIYKINQKDIAAIRVPVPELADQERIVRAVTTGRESVEKLVNEVVRTRVRGRALRHSLLAAAFSGQIVSEMASVSLCP